MLIYLSFLAAALYLIAAALPFQRASLSGWIAGAGWVLHGISLWSHVFAGDMLRVGFSVMLSAALWMTVTAYSWENRGFHFGGIKYLLLPPAALAAIAGGLFPGNLVALAGKPVMFPWHVAVALMAYSTLTIAAFHAAIMLMQDKHLHRLRARSLKPWMAHLLDQLPALMTMEKVLFRLLSVGFVLLSLTVLSGVLFSEQVLGVVFRWNHKVVLSLFSWLLFGVLLAGRHWQGWRGKKVLTFTLSGFIFLLLAYVGSHFVLEVILHRSAG